MRTIENIRAKMLGHLLRNDKFISMIVDGKIERRRSERPRMAYSDQLKKSIVVSSNNKVKEAGYERKVEDTTPTRT